jgi:flagellar biosynthesis chaperone FliJ
MQQELTKATEELQKMKEEKKKSDRIALVSEKLGMSKAEAEGIVSFMSNLEDESFAGVIAKQSDYLSTKMAEYEAAAKKLNEELMMLKKTAEMMPKEEMEKEETCSCPKAAMAEEDNAEVVATEEVLENAEVKEEAALNVPANDADPIQTVASQIAAYLGVETENLGKNEE